MRFASVAGALLVGVCAVASADNHPPDAPIIQEPEFDGQIVNPSDVHMETVSFSDPDVGDVHLCTDWEIWSVSPAERVWRTACIGGVESVHTHLGDGTFENSLAGRTQLNYETEYVLRVRHRDNSGDPDTEWSPWSERHFQTGSQAEVYPLTLSDVDVTPAPTWKTLDGQAQILPPADPPPKLRLESSEGALLLEIAALDGVQNQWINPAGLGAHYPVRVRISSGGLSGDLLLGDTDLTFHDGSASQRKIYLPGVSLAPGSEAGFWVAAGGATFYADPNSTVPVFSSLARSGPVPWAVRQPGFVVEKVASGFQLPVNIAFIPNPDPHPQAPWFYVTELYGTIRVVKRDGSHTAFAENLINFNPTGSFPGSGEQGLTGITVDPNNGDVYATLLYSSPPPNGPHYPKVIRLTSSDGGLTADVIETILEMPGEIQGQSHQISTINFGPDGMLYVHMGDGFVTATGQNLDSFRGKILRMRRNGSPPPDNPLYDESDGITSRDYLYAWGLRNPFGGDWRYSDNMLYQVENGPAVDRFSRIEAGRNYLWSGTNDSMHHYAIYVWIPAVGPVNIAVVQPERWNGSGFPPEKMGAMYVTESGSTYATGPQGRGKRISQFMVDAQGALISGPTPLVEYVGVGKATAAGLRAGPDGLYFSDLYKDVETSSAIERGANILRIRFLGDALFTSDVNFSVQAPATVQFIDQSNVPGATSWSWEFGDGATSQLRHPIHVYQAPGVYDVRLSVVGSNGVRITKKSAYMIVGDGSGAGIRGDYYDNIDFTNLAMTRIDPATNFTWGMGSPSPQMGTDHFSVRWRGKVIADATDNYTFTTITDDGVRLWVDGQLLIDKWINQSATEHSGSINMVGGQPVDIVMEYYENTGGATAQLFWQRAGHHRQLLTSANLRYAIDADVSLAIQDSANPVIAGEPLSYTVTVSNAGPDPATGVWLTVTPPVGLYELSATPSQGVLTESDPGLLRAYLGTIPVDGQAVMTIEGTLGTLVGGEIELTASVSINEIDSDGGDNSVTHQTVVHLPPAISEQSGSLTVCLGRPASFHVTAVGYPEPQYQWRRNAIDIPGENDSVLTIPSVRKVDLGVYDCVISNAVGQTISEPVTLSGGLCCDDGDPDRDGDVDLHDLAQAQRCTGLPGIGDCACVDTNNDQQVDGEDGLDVISRMTGPLHD